MYHTNRAHEELAFGEFEAGEFEFEGEQELYGAGELDGPFSEAEEMELAAELLEITDEAELDQFIGKLLKKAWRGVRGIVRTVARPLGGVLKTIAKKALPFVGGALGSLIPVPGVGTAVGTALGSALSKALELELEGVDPEDQEFEMARRFVRLAGAAAQQAAQAQPGADPQAIVQRAVTEAARQHVPQIDQAAGVGVGQRRNGHWKRRGNAIVLFGV